MIVIHHNPDCGTSRNVLAIIEACVCVVLARLSWVSLIVCRPIPFSMRTETC